MPHREAAPAAGGGRQRRATSARFARAEERFRARRWLRRRGRGPPHRWPASASPPTASTSTSCGAVRRRAAPGRAGPHPVRRQRRAPARRAHQPPRHRRQGVADGVPAHLPRRAPGDQPRPRPARRGHHPRAAPRPERAPATSSSTRAPTRSTGTARAARRGAPGQDGRRPGDGDQPAADPGRLDSAPRPRRPAWPRASTSGSPASRPSAVEAPDGDRTLQVRLPDAAARRAGRARGRRPGQGLRRPAGVRGRRLRRRAGRAAAGAGPQRRRQDQPAAHPGRRDDGRRGDGSASATRSASATTPRSTRASRPAASLLDHMRERLAGLRPRRRCAACSACSA